MLETKHQMTFTFMLRNVLFCSFVLTVSVCVLLVHQCLQFPQVTSIESITFAKTVSFVQSILVHLFLV